VRCRNTPICPLPNRRACAATALTLFRVPGQAACGREAPVPAAGVLTPTNQLYSPTPHSATYGEKTTLWPCQSGVKKLPARSRGLPTFRAFGLSILISEVPTSKLEPLTSSHSSDNSCVAGVCTVCKSRISKPLSLLCLAVRCTVLRSRWCQSGVTSPSYLLRLRRTPPVATRRLVKWRMQLRLE
jgi:hypothetical protein